jgi:hypothetical protein
LQATDRRANQTSTTRNFPYTFWSADIGQWYNSTDAVEMNEGSVPGDILFRDGPTASGAREWKHLAFLSENGMAVQAQMSATGVYADEKYDAANWTARRRLKDYYFD